jgi:hypothetical protein
MTSLVAVDCAKLSAKRILAYAGIGPWTTILVLSAGNDAMGRRRLPEHIANTLMQQQRVSS